MGKLSIIIGAQWGDEGKGKWVDQIAKDIDIVCRFQGGNNAGHTIFIKGNKHVLHLLPNGVFHPHTKIVLSSAVVIDPTVLVREIQEVSTYVDIHADRLWISPMCHVITPWHVYLDSAGEERAVSPIGTTRRGIGPTYADRALRRGLTMSEFVNAEKRKRWSAERKDSDEAFRTFFVRHSELWSTFERTAEELDQYVCPAEFRVRRALADGKNVLCEGAQGILLDLAHGSYPYVTANSTHAAQAAVSLGINPRTIDKIWGVAKVYSTRVGEGPFPTELFDEAGRTMLEKGKEFGSTTRRPRRCGWFDAVAMRYAQELNGFDGVFFSKLDILSGFKEVKICVAYKHPRLGVLENFPTEASVLAECTPVYETFKGWTQEIPSYGDRNDLPLGAKEFLNHIEKFSGCKVLQIGTGPDRDSCLNV
jgi:adenylosuccinate synthase